MAHTYSRRAVVLGTAVGAAALAVPVVGCKPSDPGSLPVGRTEFASPAGAAHLVLVGATGDPADCFVEDRTRNGIAEGAQTVSIDGVTVRVHRQRSGEPLGMLLGIDDTDGVRHMQLRNVHIVDADGNTLFRVFEEMTLELG